MAKYLVKNFVNRNNKAYWDKLDNSKYWGWCNIIVIEYHLNNHVPQAHQLQGAQNETWNDSPRVDC
jgi:hypothetical protein